jgi:hypothetical protein
MVAVRVTTLDGAEEVYRTLEDRLNRFIDGQPPAATGGR